MVNGWTMSMKQRAHHRHKRKLAVEIYPDLVEELAKKVWRELNGDA